MAHHHHNRGASTSVQSSPYTSSTPLLSQTPHLAQRSPYISSSPPSYATPKMDSSAAFASSAGGGGVSHLAATRDRLRWTSASRRSRVRDFVAGKLGKGLIMAMLVVLGWELGWLSAAAGGGKDSRAGLEQAVKAKVEIAPIKVPRCDPYEQHGMLMVNSSSYPGNHWRPFRSEASCQAVNYMNLMHETPQHDSLEYLRGKTILLMGDSVDRDHNEHFCGFMGGRFDQIDEFHAASPPPPRGIAVGEGGNAQSRPYECYVDRYDLRIISVFHFGFRPAHQEGEWLLKSPHFYEPSTPEDRFEQIAVELVKNLAGKPAPDLFSFTSGFWDLMRQVFADEAELERLVVAGTATDEDRVRLDPWSELHEGRLEWYGAHFERFIKKVVQTWPGDQPRFLWRGLHRPKHFKNAPVHRVQAVDQLGRSIVERLINEDRSAREELRKMDKEDAGKEVKASAKSAKQRTNTWLGKKRDETNSADQSLEARSDDSARRLAHERSQRRLKLESQVLGTTPLGERMAINPWGSLIAGQERHFRDDVHPNAFPSSWLYGNTLLHQLQVAMSGVDLSSSQVAAV